MSQWKSFLVVTFFLVGLMPTATPQAAVAYSISFANGQVNLDVNPESEVYYSEIETNEESRFEFSEYLKDNESRMYTNNAGIENNQKILYLTIYVDWSIENWTYTSNFSMDAFGLSKSSSEQSGSMELTWYVNEYLFIESFAIRQAENESDFESSFFKNAPSLSMSFDFTGGNEVNFSEVYFEVTTKIVTWDFTDITAGGGIGCTEMVVSNEGQATIDVDVSLSGGGVTISPGAVSVTLAPGGYIQVPICVLAEVASSYKTVQVTAIAQGRETNTQLNQVNKNAGFAVIINQYARVSVQATMPTVEFCLGQDLIITFVAVNNGNYQDTVAIGILNEVDLRDAGITTSLAAAQYQIDAAGEQPVQISVSTTVNASSIEIPLIVEVSTTLQGETAAANATTMLKVMGCKEEGESVETLVPSLSLIAVVTVLGIISILRRR